ncbi:MAG: DEAD/DEAH box helicase [Deltaproteobacteria bacterium]|nr:DEAD/DEAH box helicase [Deltaproteobacteria bacterium]
MRRRRCPCRPEERPMSSFRDRLTRLTAADAARLLGPRGAALLRAGGKFTVELEEQVRLTAEKLRVELPGAVATIAAAPKGFRLWCTACPGCCEHLGAALSLVLEEKTALGLAAEPATPAVPAEGKPLTDDELVAQAVREREERARAEPMTVHAAEAGTLWTDYAVTSSLSGKTYRVALRGLERGDSYCSCPDFRKNTLGTCKHILHVLAKAEKRFSRAAREKPPVPAELAVHLAYGRELELRLLVPPTLDRATAAIVKPLSGRPISDLRDLLSRLRQLEALGRDVIVYPDAEEYLAGELSRERLMAVAAEIRGDPASHPLRATLLKAPLLPYQLDGIAFAAGAGRAILADDMGLGKTIQGIGVAELLAREAGVARVLVVCPTSLKAQWASEVERFSGRTCQLVLGSAEERLAQYEGSAFFTVVNYEQVLRDLKTVEAARWDLIVLDEGQRIKNWEAKTSRVIKGLRSRFALVLSGTPLENRLDDLFSIMEFLDDRRLGPAFRFFHRHRVTDERGKVLGYKNLDDLREKLRPVLLRRTRGEVMEELPPRTTEIRRIPPTAEQVDIHEGQKRTISSIVRKKFLTEMDLLRLQKALLLCRMVANSTFLVDKDPPGYSSKLAELDQLLGDLLAEEGRKILLFSEWTTMLGLIEPLLAKRNAGYVRLDGSVPQAKRQALVNRFQRDAETKLFLTTNAGSTGLNLQAADTVINVDLPWNPAVLEQRVARAHRMGQKRPVQVFLLVTQDTLEEGLLGTLAAKHDLALAALDPASNVSQVDLRSGIEELRKRLEVLVGGKTPAPVDESQREKVTAELERVRRKEKVAAAGGRLLGAALGFLGEVLGRGTGDGETERLAESLTTRLTDCLEPTEDGRVQLKLTLPEPTALEGFARSLAQLFASK